MHLARAFIDYFYKRVIFVSNTQFMAWCESKQLKHPQEVDGAKLISDFDMHKVVTWYSELFFGSQFDYRFEWETFDGSEIGSIIVDEVS